jgi:uncharacterized protein YqjF (DUF2071 family)
VATAVADEADIHRNICRYIDRNIMRSAVGTGLECLVAALARLEQCHLEQPRARRFDVLTTLADFAMVTWAIDPAAVACHLAPGFEPDVRVLDDGRRVAMVSAVAFRDLDFRFAIAPWLRLWMGQTNYRTYVIRNGQRCAWFFGTSLTRPFVAIPRLWWKLPWHAAHMRFDVGWDGERCTHYELTTRSRWGPAELVLEGSDRPMGRLDGFADAEETLVVLTHPLEGFYYRTDGRVGSYSIWHAPLDLAHARVATSRFPVLERLGLVTIGQPVHSALVQRRTEFLIRLPPHVAEP